MSDQAASEPAPEIHKEEEHTATVEFWNTTGQPLLSVGYVHRYYGQDTTEEELGPLPDRGFISGKKLVKYTTGIGVMHADWWLVSVVDERGNVYISDPDNGRCWIDKIEKAFKDDLAPALKHAFDEMMKSKNNKTAAAGAAGKLTVIMLDLMTNQMDTCGFKKCDLSDDDQGKSAQIELKRLASSTNDRANNGVRFYMNDGTECYTNLKMVQAATH